MSLGMDTPVGTPEGSNKLACTCSSLLGSRDGAWDGIREPQYWQVLLYLAVQVKLMADSFKPILSSEHIFRCFFPLRCPCSLFNMIFSLSVSSHFTKKISFNKNLTFFTRIRNKEKKDKGGKDRIRNRGSNGGSKEGKAGMKEEKMEIRISGSTSRK